MKVDGIMMEVGLYVNLYVDDLRDIPEGFTGARNFEEAVEILKSHNVSIISLDHDLGEDVNGNILKSGYDLVKWICENYETYNLKIGDIYIHTDNPVGRENMYETLKAAKRRGFISVGNIYHYGIVPNKYSGE